MSFTFGPIQTAWLEALESGNYSQTRDYLQNDQGFCCLGIACSLVSRPNKILPGNGTAQYGNQLHYMPEHIVIRCGFRDSQGSRSDGNDDLTLSMLNDNGATFAEIAALVRAEPEQYFKESK